MAPTLDETTLAACEHQTTCSVHACKHPSLHINTFTCVFSHLFTLRRTSSVFHFLSTNSRVRSWTRSDPVWDQSTLGSIPSVTGLVLLASDWPEPPSAGAARGSQPAFVRRPIWGTLPLWPQRRRWTAPLAGCSTGSPGRPGSKGHCSVPETAPWTTGGGGEMKFNC